MYLVTQDGWICASHQVSKADGSLEPIHGHNWRIQAVVAGDKLDSAGVLIDGGLLERLLDEAIDHLDHQHFNDMPEFKDRPVSAEVVAEYLAGLLAPKINREGRRLAEIRVWQTERTSAAYLTD